MTLLLAGPPTSSNSIRPAFVSKQERGITPSVPQPKVMINVRRSKPCSLATGSTLSLRLRSAYCSKSAMQYVWCGMLIGLLVDRMLIS